MNPSFDRRSFLGHAGRCALFLGTAPLVRRLQQLTDRATARAGSKGPYKALVCVYLGGGHDSFNLLVPAGGADYTAYAATRDNLAVPQAQVLPITPATALGRSFGLHPSATDLQALFAAGRLAFVANVGTLVQPITRAQYRAGSMPRPKNLFSHSDQTTQWQSPSAQPTQPQGWGGRIADFTVALNLGNPLSPGISLAGSNRLLRGQTVVPYALSSSGSTALQGTSGTDGARRLATYQRVLGDTHGHVMERAFADLRAEAIELDAGIRTALAAAPALTTVFPDSSLGRQLRMAARMIGIRDSLGMQRQLFFTRMDGFDTHDNQLVDHPRLLAALGQALAAFQAAMDELGIAADVTLFTLSDFGRTLTTNGRGSDHGWGSVQMVLGGSVHGGDLYGTMPDYTLDGPDDAGGGRVIPTTAVDQYAATLASWFGVQPTDLGTVFPRLSAFASSNLGFV